MSNKSRKKLSARAKDEYIFLQDVISKKSDCVEALEILGDIYSQSGELESACQIDKRLIDIQPLQPYHYYNLACDYALMGKKKEAFLYLKIAITLGFDDFQLIKEDPDLASLKGNPSYEKLIRKIKTGRVK